MIGLLLIPLLAFLALLAFVGPRLLKITAILSSGLALAAAAALALSVARSGNYLAWGGRLDLDGFAALVLLGVAFVVFQSAWASAGYFEGVHAVPTRALRQYYTFWSLFALSMLAAPLVTNLAVLWALVELTTLSSALLVAFDRSAQALEGAWKYVVVVTVGVSLAFLATILIYYAAIPVLGPSFSPDWTILLAHAKSLDKAPLAIALFLGVVGYGTKVGLVPMHTWLPDAHAVAPAPVSALLSGTLLNVALLGVVRFWQIGKVALGPGLPDQLLLVFGFASLLVAAFSLARQNRLKRLLAYSSVEHMGIVTLGLAVAPYLALLQMINHSLIKSTLFFAAGNATQKRGTALDKLAGVIRRMPLTGLVLLVAGVAITGAPPFDLFASEFGLVQELLSRSVWLGAIFLALLALVFLLFMARWTPLIFGADTPQHEPQEETSWPSLVPLLIGLGLILMLSLFTPAFLQTLLHAGAKALSGGTR